MSTAGVTTTARVTATAPVTTTAPITTTAAFDANHCITCGDGGDPMTVIALDAHRGLALCSAPDGTRSSVETALVEPVCTGDRLLVHAGTAIAKLASELAARPEPEPQPAYTTQVRKDAAA